jgi:hypothetical protein
VLLRLLLLLPLALPLSGCYQRLGFGDDDDDDSGVADDDDAGDDDAGDDDAGDDDVGDDDAGDDDAGDDDVGDDDTAAFEITEIDPEDGSAQGGYTVEIFFEGSSGASDEDEVTVLFGTAAADVLALTDSKIVVMAPPGCVPGDVDVSVSTTGGASDSEDFEYLQWAVGLDGGVFALTRMWIPSIPQDVTQAEVEFFEPAIAPPLTAIPPLGGCSLNTPPPTVVRDHYSVGNQISVSGGSAFALTMGGDGYYVGQPPVAQLPFGGSYSIYGAVDPDGCPMVLDNVIQAPVVLNVTDPVLADLYQCWRYNVGLGLGLVEWMGPYDPTNNRVIIQVLAEPGNPSAGQVVCHAQDNGVFVIDDNYMVGMAFDAFNSIIVTRYRVVETQLQRSGATAYGLFLDSISGQIYIDYVSNICG